MSRTAEKQLIEAVKGFGAENRVVCYAMHYLAEISVGLTDMVNDVEELEMHASRNGNTKQIQERLNFIAPLIVDRFFYMKQVICDIEASIK